MDIFHHGKPLEDCHLTNRLELVFESFLKERMQCWCRSLLNLQNTLNLNLDQMDQFMKFLHTRSPALEERINFMESTKNDPAPDHEEVNPADCHFQPEAQQLLRELYSQQPDRTMNELGTLVLSTPTLENEVTHNGNYGRIVKQVGIWWDCQHDVTHAQIHRLKPAYLNDEQHLLFDLVQYSLDHKTVIESMAPLAANMWRYRSSDMVKDLNTINNIWIDPEAMFLYVSQTLKKSFSDRVHLRQEKLTDTIEKTLAELDEVWKTEGKKTRMTTGTTVDPRDVEAGIFETAISDFDWINYNLYYQATLERDLLAMLVDRFGTEHNQSEVNIARHLLLIYGCDAMWGRLIAYDTVHRQQRETLLKKIDYWMKNRNNRKDRKMSLPSIPAFYAGHPVAPPLYAPPVYVHVDAEDRSVKSTTV